MTDKPITTDNTMTKKEAYEVLVNRVSELFKEIDKYQNVIHVNKGHITAARRRIVILNRGIKSVENNKWAKAERIFTNELDKQNN